MRTKGCTSFSETTESALVLFSGGQDSTACLAWALNRFAVAHTVGFDYGQRHSVEMACRLSVLDALPSLSSRPAWKTRLGADRVLDLSVIGELAQSALIRNIPFADLPSGLPNTFVPGRNLMFLLTAAALAKSLDCRHLVAGVCETDFSGYPDCRDDTIKALQVAVNLGMDMRCIIHTPLMWLDKSMTWKLTEQEGGPELVSLIRTQTHTCYLGERTTLHDWGYGCGTCPACILRARGWTAYTGNGQAGAS